MGVPSILTLAFLHHSGGGHGIITSWRALAHNTKFIPLPQAANIVSLGALFESSKTRMRKCQGKRFDEMRIPWEYDPNVGPVLASPVAGRGDGMFIYVKSPQDTQRSVTVGINPTPTPESEFSRRRHESLMKVMRIVQEDRALASVSSKAYADTSESDGSLCGDTETGIDNSLFYQEDRKLPCRRRDVSNSDNILTKAGYRIEQRARVNGGRIDLTIIAPDGRRFRSKSSALTHMETRCS